MVNTHSKILPAQLCVYQPTSNSCFSLHRPLIVASPQLTDDRLSPDVMTQLWSVDVRTAGGWLIGADTPCPCLVNDVMNINQLNAWPRPSPNDYVDEELRRTASAKQQSSCCNCSIYRESAAAVLASPASEAGDAPDEGDRACFLQTGRHGNHSSVFLQISRVSLAE